MPRILTITYDELIKNVWASLPSNVIASESVEEVEAKEEDLKNKIQNELLAVKPIVMFGKIVGYSNIDKDEETSG